MRLVTYKYRDRTIKPGVLLDQEIVDISDQAANIGSLIAGVGLGRTPHRWLRVGETIITEVEGLGQLVNPVVVEA